MTVVFVHGVPETTAVWGPLVAELGRTDVELLGLPGFGSPAPAFEATMHNYATWMADALSGMGEIDLVAHDWGALLALRVLADRPANVRSWAMDGGSLDDSFEWHDVAKLWISPEGEGFMDGVLASSAADRGALLASVGIPEVGAAEMGESFDATMAAAILTLYRSSVDIGTEWGPGIDSITGPGIVIDATADPFKNAERPRLLAERTGAQVVQLPGAGHWWMLDSPTAAAEALTAFWAGLDA